MVLCFSLLLGAADLYLVGIKFKYLTFVLVEGSTVEAFSTEQPISSSGARMPPSPRRPVQQLSPRLNVHPAQSSELGPPVQVPLHSSLLGEDDCPGIAVLTFLQSVSLFDVAFYHLVFPAACSCSPPVSGSAHSWNAELCCKSF